MDLENSPAANVSTQTPGCSNPETDLKALSIPPADSRGAVEMDLDARQTLDEFKPTRFFVMFDIARMSNVVVAAKDGDSPGSTWVENRRVQVTALTRSLECWILNRDPEAIFHNSEVTGCSCVIARRDVFESLHEAVDELGIQQLVIDPKRTPLVVASQPT